MGSIMIGITRFLKNKNTVTIFGILVSLGILYWAYNYRINREITPVNVPYAISDIAPKTKITEEMISTKKVPGGLIDIAEAEINMNNIIGKYVRNDAFIPRNSIFYKDMIVDWDDLPSSLYENIPNGYTIYQLPVSSETTYGNSIYPGNIIDIYVYMRNSDGILEGEDQQLFTKYIENIEVLAVTDNTGNNVFEVIDTPLEPDKLIFAVPDCLYVTLMNADSIDNEIEFIPIPKNSKVTDEKPKTNIVGTMITQYINSNSTNLSRDNKSIDQSACNIQYK